MSTGEGRTEMFSAATFFDVLESRAPVEFPVGEPGDLPAKPAIVAFYGFRGGAGRTLALAHVATLLSRLGAKIACIDLDLEAPGLHAAFGLDYSTDSPGALSLLYEAARHGRSTDISRHVLTPASGGEGLGRVMVLPAGQIDRRYLAQLEELGTAMWHVHDRPSPLESVLDGMRALDPDAIFIDCRTGFSGMSASVLFHHADLVIVFVPLSVQVLTGLSLLLQAASAAKTRRGNRPSILLVPAMVPPGETGRILLDRFLPQLRDVYIQNVGALASPDAEDPDSDAFIGEALRYDLGVAAVGAVDKSLQQSSWNLYDGLARDIAHAIGVSHGSASSFELDARRILEEIAIDRTLAFAEESPFQKLAEHFVAQEVLKLALDRSTSLVVGAKGAGKTWLWRYLVNEAQMPLRLPEGIRFIVGHGPKSPEQGNLQLSPDALREIEAEARMTAAGSHKAFWYLYAVARIAAWEPTLREPIVRICPSTARKAIRQVVSATTGIELKGALVAGLKLRGVGTLAESLMEAIDGLLLQQNVTVTLVYDGLDTGFEGREWVQRRDRFTTALLNALADSRSRLKRVLFKVFLREDIFLSVSIQNKSHLDALKCELRWNASDLWRIALNTVATSPSYEALIQSLEPGIRKPWPVSEEKLRSLLIPFWGETVERGKAARTANYIQKRTSDAAERLFPRTLIQVLEAAIAAEKGAASLSTERVIRFSSLQQGIARASAKRVEDLVQEYTELSPYLLALEEMTETATAAAFIKHMKARMPKTKKGGGVTAGALHAGTGGWQKVIDQLMKAGVLGAYRRAGERETGEKKLQVALLYRAGLKIKQTGLK